MSTKEQVRRWNHESHKKYRDQRNAKHREWGRKNKLRILCEKHRLQETMRSATIQHYGGKCVDCGEQRQDVLAFDHRSDDGYLWRKVDRKERDMTRRLFRLMPTRDPKMELRCVRCNIMKYVAWKRSQWVNLLLSQLWWPDKPRPVCIRDIRNWGSMVSSAVLARKPTGL